MTETVLVTGASGFIALHVIKQLLEAGYKVRGTVRSIKNEDKIRPIKEVCPWRAQNLELVEADLTDSTCWNAAMEGCQYVLHIASPITLEVPKDPQVLIKPAVEGTLNVLRAAAATKGGVKRVVVTSSMAAVCYGYLDCPGRTFDERDWTRTDGGKEIADVTAYIQSKVHAEKAAWDYMSTLSGDEKFEMCTINPSGVMGPQLSKIAGASSQGIKMFMMGETPLIPKVFTAFVDVRDVARAHVAAMTVPEAAGQRFLCSEKGYWFRAVCEELTKTFKPLGYTKIPTREAPNFLLRGVSCFDKSLAAVIPSLGHTYHLDNTKLRTVLKVDNLIPMSKSITDMGHSLINKGIVTKSAKYVAPADQ